MVTRIKNIVFFIPALALLFVLQACVIAPAALPRVDEISPSEPLGYDGIWMISGINKRLQFDSGRAVVLDPWNHWGFGVEKGMVALINVRTAANGLLLADDLVNAGSAWRASMNANGRLDVTVETSPLPIQYELIPVTLDYPDFVRQLTPAHAGNATHQSVTVPSPVTATLPAQAPAPGNEGDFAPEREDSFAQCVNLVVDPQTNQEVCLD